MAARLIAGRNTFIRRLTGRADHVAVRLFLDGVCSALTLHLPCPWVAGTSPRHFDNGGDWDENPGALANYCHDRFSRVMGYPTQRDIEAARGAGAVLEAHHGFGARNSAIARSQYLIAFTWGDVGPAGSPGTQDAWRKAEGATRLYVCLWDLVHTAV